MRLLYGTYNPAKLASMREMLAALPVELIGLTDLKDQPSEVSENGFSPLDNARLKAIGYQAATGMTTLAADSGLYLDNVPDALQPGTHARRTQAERMDDEAMIRYYAQIAASMGGCVRARYRNGLCIAFTDGHIVERFDDSVASEPFYLVDTPHPRRTQGFPLDSLSVEIASGQYYNDLKHSRAQSDLVQENGYLRFVREALGLMP